MSAMRDFWNVVVPSISAAGRVGSAPVAAGGAPAEPVDESNASASSAAPTPSAERKAEVTKRLAALIGPYKEVLSQNGPPAAQMQSLMAAAKKHITQRDFEQAAKVLDHLEPLVGQSKILNLDGIMRDGGTHSVAAPEGAATVAPDLRLQSITLSPADISMVSGAQLQFSARGLFSDGSSRDLMNGEVDWSSSAPDVVSVDKNGLASAQRRSGTATITAWWPDSGISASSNITVIASDLRSITISPPNFSINAGGQLQFSAMGVRSNGSSKDVTSDVAWSSSPSDVVSIDDTGLASAQSVSGTATITATDRGSGVSASTQVTVTAEVFLQSITISPANPSIVGPFDSAHPRTLQFRADGKYSNGDSKDLTKKVDWSAPAPDVVSIAVIDESGLAYVVGAGSVTITAKDPSSGVTGSTRLTVKPVVLRAITISPEKLSIVGGGQQQFHATGVYSDGASQDNVTSKVAWSSSAPKVVSIEKTGLASVQEIGSAIITAKYASVTGSTKVTVLAPGAGARKISVHFGVKDFRNKDMSGYEGIAEFTSPGAKHVVVKGEIKNGVLDFANLWLMPTGSVHLKAVHPGKTDVSLSGLMDGSYKWPAGRYMEFIAKQQMGGPLTVEAETDTEAIDKSGATKWGLDFEVIKLGGELEHSENKKNEKRRYKWQVTWGTDTFTLEQLNT